VRGAVLMRNRIVLTASLILIFSCPFLHGGIFALWIIVLHAADSYVNFGPTK
jgi:hypothetical protein